MHRGHEWVDLGLPSGTKWATMNIGAKSVADYGDYFAWGETSPKNYYDESNLKFRLEGDKFSKYVTDNVYGSVDGKKELERNDDAAHVNWGSGWRMPSKSQLSELRNKCKWIWTSINGINGYNVIGPNGNTIFLPAGGCKNGNISNQGLGTHADYWSSTLRNQWNNFAFNLEFYSAEISVDYLHRYFGCNVRAVLYRERALGN